MWSLDLDGDGAMSCSGPAQSGGVRYRQHTNDRTGVVSRLQSEWRISRWSASGQSKRPPDAAAEPRRWRRVPWARRRSAAFAHPHTPYTDRATGLLDPVARNLTRFFEIVIRFQRNRPDIPYQETPPSSLNDGYPAGNA